MKWALVALAFAFGFWLVGQFVPETSVSQALGGYFQ